MNASGIGSAENIALFQDSDLVKVYVGNGEERESWTVHTKLLTHASSFFASAFNGSFSEAATKSIELPEDDPDAFRLFVQWLYTGKFVMREMYEDQYIGEKFEFDGIPLFACNVWHLGDKLGCPIFKDFATIRLISCYSERWLTPDHAGKIYQVSPPGSLIRQLAVDQTLWDFRYNSEDWMEDVQPSDWAASIIQLDDFNRDILERMMTCGDYLDDPCKSGSRYLEVLDYEKHGT
ncbi:MAG: hypothetical protein Q9220_000658 [cf. Caloplaca sp. 1 TL-2023]